MKYYTQRQKSIPKFKPKKRPFPFKLILLIMLIILMNFILYLINKRILPMVLSVGEIEMKAEVSKIINEESVKVYSENFNYDDIIHIDKDLEGNITMVRSDTVKQNSLASQVVLKCNERLKSSDDLSVKIPLGYITNNVLFYNLGPKITVKIQQVGAINTSYESVFESAGINQTRHKIYLDVKTTMRIVVPFKSKDIDVTCQIPVSDTIIVGKIPDTAINMNSNN
ncbi:sporulation protein YunB [Clostridium celatum]|uniref:sporulation protein YunB n=1 Tax=Clostridium celatum TaxID=36834 RepID=UPI00189B12DE|nr:sporulation protein YunB [Clostridium celatum]MCE9654315.1 sporulation protein YunB [Clostridium celatum]MDU3724579.1 sporulation protein YunB [Clostridium celatum]MDU6295275.1 sporulation protein YunB [Clostridium celatum]